MKKKKKNSSNSYHYFLSIIAIGSIGTVQANPENPHVVNGEVSKFNPASHILEITSGKKAIIEWDSFSIANHEVTRFIQQDSSSSVLNRVTGDMSQILGTLESNGKVFLINPSGIIVGDGARIDTGSFIASTFDILNADFLEGKELLFSGDSDHAIVNLGTIHATEGDVILLAHRIKNDGMITAEQGQVSLNSGRELLLQSDGSKVFIRPKLSKKVSNEIGIENTGTIQAIEAHLKADGNLFAQAINHSGVIEATGIENRNGRIHLVAENSKVDISGSMTASSCESGGEIHVIGNQINVLDNAKIDVSGIENGGEILIGGDAHGDNPLTVPHASFTMMSDKATITASSLSKGNGGKVVLWADENTNFFGKITAKGGPLGGDGGFVEISSPNTITFKGKVDLSAPMGADGHLLLDPGDIRIGAGGTPTCCISDFCREPAVSLPNVDTTIINITDLHDALLNCNVTLDTARSNQDTPGIISIGLVAIPDSHTLTLIANNSINVFGFIQINSTGSPTSGNVLVFNTPGDVRFVGSNNLIPAGITHSGDGGSILIECDNLILRGGLSSGASSFISLGLFGATTPISLTVVAQTNVALNGGIDANGAGAGSAIIGTIGTNGLTNTINITAGNEILLDSGDAVASITSTQSPITFTAPTISMTGNGESGSGVEILGSGTSSLTFNTENLILSTSGATTGDIRTVNGNISGTVGNLTIEPKGSQNNFISTSGTGNISFVSNQENGTYLLASAGTSLASINTGAGTISLDFQGFNSGLSLLGLNSPAQILRTGPAVGNITITGTNTEAFLLVNGALNTSTLSSASIENRSGNIIVNFPGANSEILVGSNNVSSTSFIQTTTNAGDIIITQNNGILTLQGGNGSASNAAIQTTVSGQIEIIGSGLNVNLFGGTGALSDAFISPTSSPTTITASSLSLVGGIGDVSSAFISPFTSGNITIIAPTVLLQAGSGSLFCPAAISISDTASTITITASDSLSILGGGSTGHNTAFISSNNAGNANPLNLSLGGLLIEGGHGDTTDAFITSSGSPITITGIGLNDLSLIGGIGSSSSAVIKSLNGTVTVNAPNQNLILAGNSGASSFATIEPSSGFPLHVTVNNLTMTGGSGSTSSAGLQTLASGALTITANGNISLTGGSGDVDSSAFGIARGGALTITANGNLSLLGGLGANGYANLATVSSGSPEPLTIQCANLSLIGSPTGSGIGFASIGTNLGDITIDARGFILLESGNGTHTYTQITSNQGNIAIGQNIPSFGNLSLYAGGGFNSYAQISTLQGNVEIGQTARSFGDLSLFGGNGSGAYAQISTLHGNFVTVNSGGNVILKGGNSPSGEISDASINGAANFVGGSLSLTVTGNSLTLEGGSGTGTGSNQAYILADVSASGNTMNINMSGDIDLTAGDGFGNTNAFIRSASGAGNNVTINCANLSLQGTENLLTPSGFASITSSTETTTINSSGSISLKGGNSEIGNSYALIDVEFHGTIAINTANNIHIEGGFGLDSNAEITSNSSAGASGSISITSNSLQLIGGGSPINSMGQANIAILNDVGNITINCQSAPGFIILQGGTGAGNNSVSIQADNGSITMSGNTLSVIGGDGTGNANASIFTSSANNPILLNFTGDININGIQSPSSANGLSNASITTSSTGAASPITITSANLSLLGSVSGSGQGSASIVTNVGNISITSNGNVRLIGGNAPDSFAQINATNGSITISGHALSVVGGGGTRNATASIFTSSVNNPILLNFLGDINISGAQSPSSANGLSNASITTSSTGAASSITITSANLSLLGSVSGSGQGSASIVTNVGNISITSNGNVRLIGGNAPDSFAQINATNGSITISGHALSVVGGGGTRNATASIFTSSVNNPILLNFLGDINISGAQSPYSANGLSNASITTSSTGAASPITITSANLSLLGSLSGSGQGSASIVTNVGGVSITSTGNLQLISGNAPVSFTKIQTTVGAITLSASGNIHLQGGTGTTSQSQIIRIGSTGDTTITSGSLTLSGGVGASSFAQIGTNIPLAFSFTGNIIFPSVSGDVTVTGGHLGGYALIGHGSPSASTTGINFTGNITFNSVAGNVYVSGGIQEPSFGQIGHVNSSSNSSTLSGNITITDARDVTVVNGGAPGYALIGMGGQSNTGTDSFTSDISITANNVSLQSQGLSEFTEGGYSVIGFLSPGSGIVTINSTNLYIQTTQDISRLANTPTVQPVVGIGSYVLSTSNASSATITNLTLNPRLNFSFTLDNSPSQYSDGIDFVGTYFTQNSLATGSSTITITAGRNFFFDEYMLGLANQGFLQNTNPKNVTTHLPIEITVGNGFYTSQGAGNTMSVISSGTLSVNDPSNPRGDVIISNLMQSSSGMEIIAGMNLMLGNFATLNNTTSGDINLVADNLDPTAPDFNPAFGFTLITPATVTNQNNTGKIYIYSTTEFSTIIGDGKTPSLNGNVFVHGVELGNTDTEKWGVYFPTTILSPSSYTVYYKNTEPTPRPPGPTPSQIAFLKILSFDHYEGNFLISQMLYPQPEILDDYLFWAEAFSTAYDMKKYENVRKSWGYRSSYDVFQKRKYILDRNKYFNFYELLLQRDVQIKR